MSLFPLKDQGIALLPDEKKRKLLDQYFTSDDLARRIAHWAHIGCNDSVLEPSAGAGAFAKIIKEMCRPLTAVEIDPTLCAYMESICIDAINADFIEWARAVCGTVEFNLIIGNPPYNKETIADFIRLASMLLAPYGRIVMLLLDNIFHGVKNQNGIWSHLYPTRIVHLISRPSFGGEFGAMQNYSVIEMKRRQDIKHESTSVEWW